MKFNIPRVVIAGLKGGSGKTTLSLGLLNALKKHGQRIVPFKKGPDYIDAGWLARASGQECHNLDAFLFPEKTVLNSFILHTVGYDGALIEGNRGIYDGMDEKGTFSTARLSISLSSPVILIVDCTKVTATIAALIKGVLDFEKNVRIGGVVLNRLAGARHERVIRSAVETHTNVKVIGALYGLKHDLIGERHLGLIPSREAESADALLTRISDIVSDAVNIDEVLAVMKSAPALKSDVSIEKPAIPERKGVRIGVLKDKAFQFYYPENLHMLDERGAEIVEIDALKDTRLPDVHALYIGGGFPETQALSLAQNASLLKDIKRQGRKGMPIYAECGGLMFLGKEIEINHDVIEMVGLLPLRFTMKKKPVAHGYTVVEVTDKNPYFEVGRELKGHEFHYSEVTGIESDKDMGFTFRMKRGTGIRDGYDGIVYKNICATYTHLHALGSPEWVDAVIRVAGAYKNRERR